MCPICYGLRVFFDIARLRIEPFQWPIAKAMHMPFVVKNDDFTAAGTLVNANEKWFHVEVMGEP
jgi:hypothetical protein